MAELSLTDIQNLSVSGSPVTLKRGPASRGELIVTECRVQTPSGYNSNESMTAYPPSRRRLGVWAQTGVFLGAPTRHYPVYGPPVQVGLPSAYQHLPYHQTLPLSATVLEDTADARPAFFGPGFR